MSQVSVAVIGGSGVYSLDELKIIQEHTVETPFGKPSAPIIEAEIRGYPFYFLARHGKGHVYLPSEVNYRANIFALKKLGAQMIVSVSAVGSLHDDCHPGSFVMPNQFIDWTKGQRARTFFGNGLVGHASNAEPITKNLKDRICSICKTIGIKAHKGGIYICIEGPQFSTKAESELFRTFGATIIGMTNVPEAFLAKEAGMGYSTVAMVTDYDCWKDEHCNVEDIMKVMKLNFTQANLLLKELIPSLYKEPIEFQKENANIVITAKENLSPSHKEILEVLLK